MIARYGAERVTRQSVDLAEGESEITTVLFSGDSLRRLEIFWTDTTARSAPASARLQGDASHWVIGKGVTLGATLADVERANGRPFTLTGFNWDYAGTVISWEGGQLDSLPPGMNRIIVRFQPSAPDQISDAERGPITGDRDVASTNPVMRRVQPRVYAIEIWFVEGGRAR